jgi:hypothetical protein
MRHLPLLHEGYIPDGSVWVNVYLPDDHDGKYFTRLVGLPHSNRLDAMYYTSTWPGDKLVYRVKIIPKVSKD